MKPSEMIYRYFFILLLLVAVADAQTLSREVILPLDVPLGATIESLPGQGDELRPGIALMHGSGPSTATAPCPWDWSESNRSIISPESLPPVLFLTYPSALRTGPDN